MPTVEWALLCQRIAIENGQLNIYGVADRIEATAFPIDVERVHLVAQLNGTPRGRHVITCTVNDGASIRTTGNQLTVELNPYGMAITEITILNFRITHAGVYTFAVVADGTEIGHVTLPVTQQVQ